MTTNLLSDIAFHRYAALIRAQERAPHLLHDAWHIAQRQLAYARFRVAFDREGAR